MFGNQTKQHPGRLDCVDCELVVQCTPLGNSGECQPVSHSVVRLIEFTQIDGHYWRAYEEHWLAMEKEEKGQLCKQTTPLTVCGSGSECDCVVGDLKATMQQQQHQQ